MVNAICKNPRVKWIYTRNEAEAADGRTCCIHLLQVKTYCKLITSYLHFSDLRRSLNQLTRKCDMHICHDPKSDGELLGDAPRAGGSSYVEKRKDSKVQWCFLVQTCLFSNNLMLLLLQPSCRPCQKLTTSFFWGGLFTGYTVDYNMIMTNLSKKWPGWRGQCFFDGCSLCQVNGSFSCMCGHLRPRRLQSNYGLLGLMGPWGWWDLNMVGLVVRAHVNQSLCRDLCHLLSYYCRIGGLFFVQECLFQQYGHIFQQILDSFLGSVAPINSKASGLTGFGVAFPSG